MKLLIKFGNWFVLGLFLLGLYAYWQQAKAEPTNAPDVRGHFVLVVGGTATASGNLNPWTNDDMRDIQYRIQPLTIAGFTSFHQCRSAGMEIQARLNSDGYTLDFSCIATSK